MAGCPQQLLLAPYLCAGRNLSQQLTPPRPLPAGGPEMAAVMSRVKSLRSRADASQNQSQNQRDPWSSPAHPSKLHGVQLRKLW